MSRASRESPHVLLLSNLSGISGRRVFSLLYGGWCHFVQEVGVNLGELSEDGIFMRPNVTNDEATDPDYVQQALVPMDSETHSGAGERVVESLNVLLSH